MQRAGDVLSAPTLKYTHATAHTSCGWQSECYSSLPYTSRCHSHPVICSTALPSW